MPMLTVSLPLTCAWWPAGMVLRDNHLTDVSARLLSHVVKRSSSLRLLDLRGNHLTARGLACLTKAVSDNPSVTQVRHCPCGGGGRTGLDAEWP